MCRPTQLRFVAAREDLFATPKGSGMQSTLLLVPPNTTAFRRGTGRSICHAKRFGAQSTLLLVPPNSTAFRRGTGRSICHAKRFGVQSTLFIVRLPRSLKLWRDKQLRKLACRTEGFCLPYMKQCSARLRHIGVYFTHGSDPSDEKAHPSHPSLLIRGLLRHTLCDPG